MIPYEWWVDAWVRFALRRGFCDDSKHLRRCLENWADAAHFVWVILETLQFIALYVVTVNLATLLKGIPLLAFAVAFIGALAMCYQLAYMMDADSTSAGKLYGILEDYERRYIRCKWKLEGGGLTKECATLFPWLARRKG